MTRPGNITLIGRKRKALEARFYGMHEKSWAMRQENNAACFCSVLCDIKKWLLMRRAWARQPKPAASLNYHNDFMHFWLFPLRERPRAPACAAPQHSPPRKFLPACSLIISCTFFRFSHEKPFRGLEHDSSPTVSERNLETKMGKRERERDRERRERKRRVSPSATRSCLG